jgi:hypothetical protein
LDEIEFLKPVLALVLWTCVMWFWMYATRIPAMQKAKIDMSGSHPDLDMTVLPGPVRAAADNYNHLHEQPVIFYALMFFIALTGGADPVSSMVAWAYVGLRVVHSFVQVVIGIIPLRFLTFILGSFCLFFLAGKEALRVFAG